ncbi:uncharacterized protein LOC593349 [Strongylocentrotus purpuratus]|uniref:Uncharacterized protein n=1 Tax=Strongylocentrotus purpuratus TaxID=7668 RepID=A0A7M7STC7_STRPU|nr:uncharacterized protein LOC593349 [Strongylocentrotus purpuratus]
MAAVQYPPNAAPQVVMHQAGAHPVQVAAHQPVNIVLQKSNKSDGYNARSGKITGWMQLSCAIASVVIGIIELIVGSQVSIVGTGIWSGLLFFLPTAILGIVSKKKNTCVIVAYMVMSIISAIVGFVVFAMGITSAAVSASNTCSFIGLWGCGYAVSNARITFDSFLAIIGLLELVVAIVAACYCCAGVCCGRKDTPTNTMVYHYQNNAMPMMVMVPAPGQQAGQPLLYHQPPPVNQPLGTYPAPVAYPQIGPQPGPGPQPNYNVGAQDPPLYSEVGPDTQKALPAKM